MQPKPTKPITLDTVRAAIRRLSPAERRRLAERIEELDALRQLVTERPHAGRWPA